MHWFSPTVVQFKNVRIIESSLVKTITVNTSYFLVIPFWLLQIVFCWFMSGLNTAPQPWLSCDWEHGSVVFCGIYSWVSKANVVSFRLDNRKLILDMSLINHESYSVRGRLVFFSFFFLCLSRCSDDDHVIVNLIEI